MLFLGIAVAAGLVWANRRRREADDIQIVPEGHEPRTRENISSLPIPQMPRSIPLPIKPFNNYLGVQRADQHYEGQMKDDWVPVDDNQRGKRNWVDKLDARQQEAYYPYTNASRAHIPFVGSRIRVGGV